MASKYESIRLEMDDEIRTPIRERLRKRNRTDSQIRKQEVAALKKQHEKAYITIANNITNLRKFMFEALDNGDEIDIQNLRRYITLDLREVMTILRRYQETSEEINDDSTQRIIKRMKLLQGLLWRLSKISYIPSYIRKYREEINVALDFGQPVQETDFYKGYETDEDEYTSEPEVEEVTHLSDINHDGIFQPAENFATSPDPYGQDNATEYETPPKSRTKPEINSTYVRPNVSDNSRKTAQQIIDAANNLNNRFRHTNEPEETTPRTKSKPTDSLRMKRSFDLSRASFAESEAYGNTNFPKSVTNQESVTNDTYQLHKRPRNEIGSTAPTERFVRALERITNATDTSEVRDALYGMFDQINQKVDNLSPKKQKAQSALPPGFHGPKRTDLDSSKIDFWKHVKSVDLEKFTGESDKKPFSSWWRLFDHEINRLPEPFSSNILKLRALYKLLDGEAQDLVRPFHTSAAPDSYEAAVRRLQATYGETKITKENVKDKLRKLTPTASSCSAQVEFINKILEIRADLEVAGENKQEASRQCIEVALRKMHMKYTERYYTSLSLNTKTERETFYEENPATYLEELANWISNLKAEHHFSDDEDSKPKPQEDSTVSAFVTTKENIKKPSPIKPKSVKSHRCPICKTDEHTWMHCPVPPPDRRQKIRSRGWCNNCMKEGHFSKDCPSDISCYHCMQEGKVVRHHTALCYSLDNKREQPQIRWGIYKKNKREHSANKDRDAKKSGPSDKYRKFKDRLKKLPTNVRNVFSSLVEMDSDCSSISSEEDDPEDHQPEEEKDEKEEKKPQPSKEKTKPEKPKKQ